MIAVDLADGHVRIERVRRPGRPRGFALIRLLIGGICNTDLELQRGYYKPIHMIRPRGTIVMKSTVHGQVAIDTAPVIVNEITLVGSRCGRFKPAIALLKTGRINVGDMISAEFQLADAAKAFQCAATKGVLKVLLRS